MPTANDGLIFKMLAISFVDEVDFPTEGAVPLNWKMKSKPSILDFRIAVSQVGKFTSAFGEHSDLNRLWFKFGKV